MHIQLLWRCLSAAAAVVFLLLAEVQAASEADLACLDGFKAGVSNPPVLASNWTGVDFPCAAPFRGISCAAGDEVISLHLAGLGLAGTIPASLATCYALTSLDLSRNQLQGDVPTFLSLLPNLEKLNLSGNELTGQVPSQLGNCAFLTSLDLAGNNLTGAIPSDLGSLQNLAVLNLARNQLSGLIPDNLARFNATSFRPGNKDLHSSPLPPSHRRRFTVSAPGIISIALASGFISFVISFAAVLVWLRWDSRSQEESKLNSLTQNV